MDRKRIAMYVRAGNSQTAAFEQQMRLTHFIEEHPAWELTQKAMDIGVTGDASLRAGLLSLIGQLKDGKIDLVVAQSPARFYRDAQKSRDIISRIRQQGADVVFADGSSV